MPRIAWDKLRAPFASGDVVQAEQQTRGADSGTRDVIVPGSPVFRLDALAARLDAVVGPEGWNMVTATGSGSRPAYGLRLLTGDVKTELDPWGVRWGPHGVTMEESLSVAALLWGVGRDGRSVQEEDAGTGTAVGQEAAGQEQKQEGKPGPDSWHRAAVEFVRAHWGDLPEGLKITPPGSKKPEDFGQYVSKNTKRAAENRDVMEAIVGVVEDAVGVKFRAPE